MTLFIKVGREWEPAVQSLVAELAPPVTEPVLEALPASQGRTRFAMRDLAAEDCVSVGDLINRGNPLALAAFRRSYELLALTHVRLAGSVHRLRDLGVPRLEEREPETYCACLRELPPGSPALAFAPKLLTTLSVGPPASWPGPGETLLHGDLNPSNVFVQKGGEPLLMDWGEARVGPPAWDLGLMPATMVQAYMARARVESPFPGPIYTTETEFFEQIRWAGAIKLASAVDYLVTSDMSNTAREAALNAISVAAAIAV